MPEFLKDLKASCGVLLPDLGGSLDQGELALLGVLPRDEPGLKDINVEGLNESLQVFETLPSP